MQRNTLNCNRAIAALDVVVQLELEEVRVRRTVRDRGTQLALVVGQSDRVVERLVVRSVAATGAENQLPERRLRNVTPQVEQRLSTANVSQSTRTKNDIYTHCFNAVLCGAIDRCNRHCIELRKQLAHRRVARRRRSQGSKELRRQRAERIVRRVHGHTGDDGHSGSALTARTKRLDEAKHRTHVGQIAADLLWRQTDFAVADNASGGQAHRNEHVGARRRRRMRCAKRRQQLQLVRFATQFDWRARKREIRRKPHLRVEFFFSAQHTLSCDLDLTLDSFFFFFLF